MLEESLINKDVVATRQNVLHAITYLPEIIKLQVENNRLKAQIVSLNESIRAKDDALLKYKLVAEYTCDWETWTDAQLKPVYVSRSCYEHTGYSVDEFYADPDLMGKIIHPEDLERFMKHVSKAMEHQTGVLEIEFRIVCKNAAIKWIQHICLPIFAEDGTWLGRRASNRDVTKRKTMEQDIIGSRHELELRVKERTARLKQLLGELSRTEQKERRQLAMVLHDHFQQLFAAAKLKAEMAASKADSAQVKQLLAEISDLMKDCISQSRSLSVELCPPVLYNSGLCCALEWLGSWMGEKHGLEVNVNVKPEIEPADHDIRAFLFQSAKELLFNIAKHSGTNKAWLELAPAGNCIELKIWDQGKGISEEKLSRLGLAKEGYGLFSIQQRTESFGGKLSLMASTPTGFNVTLTLPRQN
ncbi:MAG: hypothetical protein A2Y12_04035 [Planctomycetes bacterium GWF2_42_9]|nr:MAG: hypothetical protein A2Y12_04035 [Planctomycetes bacterium GWF2_42_9]